MNFDFTDDQQAIKRTAREMLAARFKPERVRQLAEAGSYDDDAWREMSELGWAGIFIEEEHGGQGLGIVELVILMEELGYALAPVPFLSNMAAGLALHFAGTHEQKERWLPGIASGEARGTVGVLRDGEARLVPDADSAEVIVLIAPDGSTAVVEASAADIEPFETMDRTRRFARVRADGGDALAVLARGAVEHRVGLRALQVEVEVVLPGEADASVHLERRAAHAPAGVGRVGLRHRGRHRQRVRLGVGTPARVVRR